MTEDEKIERTAQAMASSRNHPRPNSTDRDFATKFVTAWRVMNEIEKGSTGPAAVKTVRG
jgi:hypothetical protein